MPAADEVHAPRLKVGDAIPPIDVTTLRGDPLHLPSSDDRWVHLQFRRYAGCPICNLHLRSVARRIDELAGANVREIAVFHSEAATMLPFQGDLPFEVIADPEKALYRAYGVEASLRAILHPSAWLAATRGALSGFASGAMVGEGGHTGLPADFFIAPNGQIVALKYGERADDQWSVDEVLAVAQRASSG